MNGEIDFFANNLYFRVEICRVKIFNRYNGFTFKNQLGKTSGSS